MSDEYLEIFGDDETLTTFRDAISSNVEVECEHKSKVEENGYVMCTNCGMMFEELNYEPEWRWYGAADNRSNRDPSRCHRPRNVEKTIDPVFTNAGIDIPPALKSATNAKYRKIMEHKRRVRREQEGIDKEVVVRGTGRTAIVAACLWSVYRDMGDYRPTDEVRAMFGLTKKSMSSGTTQYNEAFPEDRVKLIKSKDLIRRILLKTGINMEHYHSILNIERELRNTSKLLIRSNVQSVAACVVYLWLCMNPHYQKELGLGKEAFASKAQLSGITITKLVNEASKIVKVVTSDHFDTLRTV